MARIENWNPPQLNYKKATYSWNVPYAADVHEGVITNNAVKPARPWTDYAVGQIDAEKEFQAAYNDTEDLTESFQSLVSVYFGEFQNAITSPIWRWNRVTYRKSGEVVSSPRDIYDLGNLFRSQEVELE